MAVIVMVCLLRSRCQAHLTPAAPLSYTECNYKSDKRLSIHFIQVSKSKKVARSPGERPNFWQPSPRRSTSLLFFFCRGCCVNQTSVVCFEYARKYMSPENANCLSTLGQHARWNLSLSSLDSSHVSVWKVEPEPRR